MTEAILTIYVVGLMIVLTRSAISEDIVLALVSPVWPLWYLVFVAKVLFNEATK